MQRAKPDQHDERNADHHGDHGDRNHVLGIALERQSGDDAEQNESSRAKARQGTRAHTRAPAQTRRATLSGNRPCGRHISTKNSSAKLTQFFIALET